jgi:chromosome segregation ATPase
MPGSIEERVAYLEGKVEEHAHGFGEVRDLIVQVQGSVLALDQKVDRFREELASRIDSQGARIDALDQKIDRFREELASRIESQGTRIDSLNQRIDSLDHRINARFEAVNHRIDALDQKMSSHFIWIVGIQITVLLSVMGTLLLR